MKSISFFLMLMFSVLHLLAQNNVGIGTTSPLFRLHVLNNIANDGGHSGGLLIENSNINTGEAALSFRNAGTLGAGSKFWCIGLNQNRNFSFSYGTAFLNASTEVVIDSTGRVGLGTLDPSERLDVSGNIKLSGEVNRGVTGSANLVPICFGTVSHIGDILSGTGNFSVTHSDGEYTITITPESYLSASYTTVVTIVSATTARMVSTGHTSSGQLVIRIFDVQGQPANSSFQFVVYKS